MTTATAVVGVLPASHQQALSILQRSEATSSTDHEKTQYQQEVLNILNNGTTANDFGKIMAQAALDVDRAFDSVQLTLNRSAASAIRTFPPLFAQALLWIQIRLRWNAKPGGLLNDSIKLAIFTSSQLDRYNNFLLQLVQDIKTEDDVKDAQAELRKFSIQQPPPDVNTNLVDGFKNLRNDVQEINTTVQILGVAWAVVAAVMNYKIKEIQSDIETLNGQIDRVLAITSGACPSFGLTKLFMGFSSAGSLIQRRAEQKRNLDEALGQFNETNASQAAMAESFAYIVLLCDNLATLATVWAEARFEAISFANKLDGGLHVTGTGAFKLTLKVARETAVTLKDGLKVYADILS